MSALKLSPILTERLSLIANIPPLADGPPTTEDMAAFGAFAAPVDGYEPPEVNVEEMSIAGPHGEIPVRVYRPLGDTTGGLVWAHGGAFMFGDLDMPESDVVARELTASAGLIVVAVEYRLCVGGVHFPVPHDDLRAAFLWAANESGFGGDHCGWALGGASAGGNLAAGVAQRLRDEGGTVPSALSLVYPMVHAALPEATVEHNARTQSMPPSLRFPVGEREMIHRNFLGENEPEVAYAFAGDGDVSGLPPTFISVADHDDLAPSGLALHQQLQALDGVVELEVVEGVAHGHLNIAGLPEALTTINAMAAFFLNGAR